MSSSALVSAPGDFVLVPAWAVHRLRGLPCADSERTPHCAAAPLGDSVLTKAAAKLTSSAQVTLRSAALADLPGASLQPGAYLMLTLGAATAAAFQRADSAAEPGTSTRGAASSC